jgi:hypothetical protein
MQNRKRFKTYLNTGGGMIVLFWLVLVGLLVKDVHFKEGGGASTQTPYAQRIDSPQREWKEIYYKGKKVGYAVILINPHDNGYAIQEKIFLKMNLMGLASGMETITRCQVDDKFLLEKFQFKITSGAVRYQVGGRVDGNRLVVQTGEGKSERTRSLPLTSKPMIGPSIGPFFQSQEIRVGDTIRIPIFDPSSMVQREAVIHVVAREPVTIHSIRYDAFRLEMSFWGRDVRLWLNEEGVVLKEEGFMGLTTLRSNAARASRDLQGGESLDFYEMNAVPVARPLPEPTRLNYLRVEISGIDDSDIESRTWHGGRQTYQNGIMEIRRETKPARQVYALPYDESAGAMAPFLAPTFNVQSDAEAIIRQARLIVGDDKNPVTVAEKLVNWVYETIEKKPVLSVPSALEVLRTKVGDCNEHTTLLTALLRAVGIPARISVGLVYAHDRFFYHAWTEAFVGEWITLDATMNQIPVDATHIKLLEGNIDRQVELVRLIGRLRLHIQDYRHD